MLVGRARELETVLDVCRRAAEGRGATLVVTGEPGIGKTELLAAAAAGVDGTVLRTTGVEAESTVAFAALQALLWPLRDRLDDELEPGQATLLGGVLSLGPQVEASTFTVAAATLALLSLCSREAPLVAVVDDAHWCDVASQEVLRFVGRRLEHERVALLAAVRESEPSLLAEERSFTHLALDGLEREAAGELLAASSPTALAPDVAARLLDACRGNPLGLVELPRVLTDDERDGTAPLPAALEAGPLVQRAFAARAARLDESARSALLLLAAAGDADAALAAMGEGERGALEAAEAAGLVSRHGRPQFRHPLMQSAVYGAAGDAERRDAHRRLGAVLDGARGVWHLAAAAAGPDEEVALALEAVAAQAGKSGGIAAQAQALERAAVVTVDEERRAVRLLEAAQAWRRAGRIEHARSLLDEALVAARNDHTRGLIELELGLNLLRALEHREAYELLSSAAARATDPLLAARLYAALTFVANVEPDLPPALVPAERAVQLAGRHDDEVELEAMFALVTARMSRGLPPDDDDAAAVGRAAELLERPELRTGEQPHWIAYSLAELEEDERARALSDLALAEARAEGDVWSLCYGLYARAALELVCGRVDTARTWIEEALPLAEQVGEPWRVDQANAVRFEIEGMRGNVAETETDLHLGRALLAVGRFDEAATYLEAAARDLAEGRPRAWYQFAPLDLAESYAAAGRAEEARTVIRTVAPGIESCRLRRPLARLMRVRALLAPEKVIDVQFGDALAQLADAPHLHEQARIELCWGERLRRSGRPADGAAHLEHALARFDALGAVGWSERAHRELEAVTGSPRPAQPRRTEVLSAQELRVARHAASGSRDREIAAVLYLSPRTVEAYLQSAYRKLDVSNRTQLAAVLAADGVAPLAKDS